MKRIMMLGAVATFATAGFGAEVASTMTDLSFAEKTQVNYNQKTKSTVVRTAGGEELVVSVLATSKVETAWTIATEKTPVPKTAGVYALGFQIKCATDWTKSSMSKQWGSDLTWLDAAGKTLAVQPIIYRFRAGDFVRLRFCGVIPEGAANVVVRLGCDGPNVNPGENVTVRNARIAWLPKGSAVPANLAPDLDPPLVKSAFTAPTPDENVVVRYDFIDAGSIDWTSVAVTNAKTKASIPFVRNGNQITLKPGQPWAKGVNALVIRVRDASGNATLSRKAFLIGEPAKGAPVATLRDDGVTLVDGKPFFPIGIYNIRRHMFNAWSFDRAFADLKAGGFNFAHSYTDFRDPEFLRLCDKYGFKAWTGAYQVANGDNWLATTGRYDKATITWYIGDDTFMNTKPSELLDRDESARMQDGTRLTCQADIILSEMHDDKFMQYVDYTDVFLPEIYPIRGMFGKAYDESCVAYTIRDMDRAWADIAACKARDSRPRTVWPILQIFHGKIWKRYPTPNETYATTFASLIHGGKGVTWFHYSGKPDPDTKAAYTGCFRTQADWAATTNMTRRIADLAPVLLERDPVQPAAPEVLEGPKNDPLGQPSVTMLMKHHAGETYVLAVNASPKRVRAKLHVTDASSRGEVLWENRTVTSSDGAFEDTFDGLGVHVYRFR